MYSDKKLVILDADGTTIDAFSAIHSTFLKHNMDLGDLQRFQKRHNLVKYLGGVKEFPKNLKRQIKKVEREKLIQTLSAVYRENGRVYDGMHDIINRLIDAPDIIVGIVTRNITGNPVETLTSLFKRENIKVEGLDFLTHIPLKQKKTETFKKLREQYQVNPSLCFVCGDEYKDYLSAIEAGMIPLIVSYGFENLERLTSKYEIPNEIISTSPETLGVRLLHALGLQP